MTDQLVKRILDAGIVAIMRRTESSLAVETAEVVRAWQLGASVVKVFPVGSVGPRYLRGVLAPLTEIPLLPTGGVTLENAAEFIRAGARGLGLGSDLVSPTAIAARDFGSLT